jgi:DNA polymerase/3'-5' exonuclease PolX
MSNEGIIEELLSTAEYYEGIGDEGRSHAYKRAVESIKACGCIIRSGAQAKKLKWIGDSISSQIDNILGCKPNKQKGGRGTKKQSYKKENRDDEHRDIPSNPKKVSVTLIDDIRAKAEKKQENTSMDTMDTIDKIRRGISPIKKDKSLQPDPTPRINLNRNNRTLRIKQYEFAPKPEQDATVVRRTDIDQFLKCVKRAWDKLIDKQSSVGVKYRGKLECCGGFRRGQTWCHECVIVLTSDMSAQRQRHAFEELLRVLYKLRFIESQKMSDVDYYQGVLDVSKLFKSNRTNQQPDSPSNIPLVLRLTDEGGWPCALLRWTGPKRYWINLQSAAQHHNYELLENGLFSKHKGGIGKRLFHRDEFDVLTDIEMGYVEPIYRK